MQNQANRVPYHGPCQVPYHGPCQVPTTDDVKTPKNDLSEGHCRIPEGDAHKNNR